MKGTPIPLVLDLWSLGHSQGQIAAMVGLPSRKHVERIIRHARELNDPRAVRHATSRRVMGKGFPWQKRKVVRKQKLDGIEIVPLILALRCKRGHLMADNRRRNGGCLTCARAAEALRPPRPRRAK